MASKKHSTGTLFILSRTVDLPDFYCPNSGTDYFFDKPLGILKIFTQYLHRHSKA